MKCAAAGGTASVGEKNLLRLHLNAFSKELKNHGNFLLFRPLAKVRETAVDKPVHHFVCVCVWEGECVMTHLAVSPQRFISQCPLLPPDNTNRRDRAAPLPLLLPHQDVITGLKAYRPDSNDIEWLDCVFWWISPWVIWRQIVFHFSYCCDFYLFFSSSESENTSRTRPPKAPPPSSPVPALPPPGRLPFVKAVILSQRWWNAMKNTIFWLSYLCKKHKYIMIVVQAVCVCVSRISSRRPLLYKEAPR